MSDPAWVARSNRCSTVVLVVIAALGATCVDATLPPCDEMDYYFQYTECDAMGSRWRVAIPLKAGSCSGLPPPSRGTDCSFSCSAGKYLDMSTQSCTPCAAGSYSLGSGLRFDQWDALPTGFLSIGSFLNARPPDGNFQACNNSTWTPRGVYLESNRDECTVSLVYVVHLEKQGSVSFTYQYPDNNIFFEFYVQNEQCQEMSQSEEQRWIKVTGNGEWGTHTINLWAGTNILYWRTTGILVGGKMVKAVLLKDIEIEGVAYTSKCFPCRPGWFSTSAGSSSCRPCPTDTFSRKKATSCAPCPENHYSLEGWAECKVRPPCSERDYFQIHTPCDSEGKTRAVYLWVEPKICEENSTDAVALPPPEAKEACPPCNPGFFNSNDSTCSPCPPGMRSDGTYACTACPSGTEPVLGYDYRWWNVLPANMKTSCFNVGNSKCDSMNGWEVAGDHVRSGAGSSDNDYLILSLHVPGFKVPASLSGMSGGEVGQVTFEFETDCSGDCEFYFMMDVRSKSTTVVESWQGSKSRQSYSHSLSRNDSVTFTWAFQRTSNAQEVRRLVSDYAKVFTIHVTNVLEGVASGCRACALVPENSQQASSSCVPCPPGFYIHGESNRCRECPPGTRLAGRHTYGLEACLACGPAAVSDKEHSRCYSDCSFLHTRDNRTLTYDLGALSDVATLALNPSFTTKGTKYLHLFNISLCGHQGRKAATCRNNLTDFGAALDKDQRGGGDIPAEGFLCQSTIIPADGHGFRMPISSQSVVLADMFLGATVERFLDGVSVNAELFPLNPNHFPDINFYYRSTQATSSCDQGRSSVIVVRCDPQKSERGQISVPSSCPAGTCDGCTFHFLWESASACPLCTKDDYHQLDGACKGGIQETFYLWNEPRLCVKGVTLPPRRSAPCASVALWLKVFAGVGAFLAVLLVTITYSFWKKNKRLEYKYSRLVMSANKECELPVADSCGLDEGEDPDDDDDGAYTRKPSLLGKLRAMAKKHEGGDSSESVQLNSSEADHWVLG
ncbi:endosome/lysosome-associated apoptosis and autophagy regulator family member 2-like isoform X1 [Stigmatopora nigra]